MAAEGTGASQLAQVIGRLGYNEYDRFELATVTSASPITVKIDGMTFDLDASDLVIAERLTDRTVSLSTDGVTFTDYTAKSPLTAGDRVIVASMSNGQYYVVLDKAVV